jgi:hypothetical protein
MRTPFRDAMNVHPEYEEIRTRINVLAALDRVLTASEEGELQSLHVKDGEWRTKLDLI